MDQRQYARATTHLAEALRLKPGFAQAQARLEQARAALAQRETPVD
jgi:hypothetical protein